MPDSLDDLDKKLARFRKNSTDNSKPQRPKSNNGAEAGMEFVAEILVGCGGGWALDRWLGTSPWLLLLGFFIGVSAGFFRLYKLTRDLNGTAPPSALPRDQKTYTKPPEISDDDDV